MLAVKVQRLIKDLNWYDLYRPLLNYKSSAEDRLGTTVIDGEVKTYKKGMTMREYTPWAKHLFGESNEEDDILLNDFFTDYMNREDVRKAFNIPSEVQAWS